MKIELIRIKDCLPAATKATLKAVLPNSQVIAAEDIHVKGEVIVSKGTSGTVESRGIYALNVKFQGSGIVFCSWDMIMLPEAQSQLGLWETV